MTVINERGRERKGSFRLVSSLDVMFYHFKEKKKHFICGHHHHDDKNKKQNFRQN